MKTCAFNTMTLVPIHNQEGAIHIEVVIAVKLTAMWTGVSHPIQLHYQGPPRATSMAPKRINHVGK